jgi:hypothetical protein
METFVQCIDRHGLSDRRRTHCSRSLCHVSYECELPEQGILPHISVIEGDSPRISREGDRD